MMVPSRTLLITWAIAGVPLCTVTILGLGGISWCWFALALLFSIAIWDGIQGARAVEQLAVLTENLIIVIRGRAADVAFRVVNQTSRNVKVRVAPEFPAGVEASEKSMPAASIAANGEALWTAKLQGLERGDWPLSICFIEAASPWGLWLVQSNVTISLLIRVYPNLSANKTALKLLRRHLSGLKAYRQLGQGREFEKLREYIPGDTYDQIYWKASAKRARPMTKVFQIERAQPSYVLIDCSRQSAAGGALDYFVEAALVLGLAAEQFGDQFGVLSFSDRVHSFERARAGRKHLGRCRNALYALQAQPVSADFGEMTRFVQTNVRRRSLLFILTKLEDPYAAEMLSSNVRLLASRHALVIGVLRKPGVAPVFEGFRPDSTSDIYSALAGHLSWKKLNETGKRLEMLGVQLVLCDRETIYEDLTNRYRQMRQRQVL